MSHWISSLARVPQEEAENLTMRRENETLPPSLGKICEFVCEGYKLTNKTNLQTNKTSDDSPESRGVSYLLYMMKHGLNCSRNETFHIELNVRKIFSKLFFLFPFKKTTTQEFWALKMTQAVGSIFHNDY